MSDYSSAISLATEVIEQNPTCCQAYQTRAKAHHAAGELDKACEDLTKAVRIAPQNREVNAFLNNLKQELNTNLSCPKPAFDNYKDSNKFSVSLDVPCDQFEKTI